MKIKKEQIIHVEGSSRVVQDSFCTFINIYIYNQESYNICQKMFSSSAIIDNFDSWYLFLTVD